MTDGSRPDEQPLGDGLGDEGVGGGMAGDRHAHVAQWRPPPNEQIPQEIQEFVPCGLVGHEGLSGRQDAVVGDQHDALFGHMRSEATACELAELVRKTERARGGDATEEVARRAVPCGTGSETWVSEIDFDRDAYVGGDGKRSTRFANGKLAGLGDTKAGGRRGDSERCERMGKRERTPVDQGHLLAFEHDGYALVKGEAGKRGQKVLDRAKRVAFVRELGRPTRSRRHTKTEGMRTPFANEHYVARTRRHGHT